MLTGPRPVKGTVNGTVDPTDERRCGSTSHLRVVAAYVPLANVARTDSTTKPSLCGRPDGAFASRGI
jgi:hypothetical protein